MKTLAETLADERDRCRRLMQEYTRIGSAGAFAAALVQQAIRKAEYAADTGHFTTMRQALLELRRFDDLPVAQQPAAVRVTPAARRPGDPGCAPVFPLAARVAAPLRAVAAW